MTAYGAVSPFVIRAFILAYLTVQIAVPLIALKKDRMTPFGWQMFTAKYPPPSIYSVLENGRIRMLGTPAATGKVIVRPEVDFDLHLPQHLCRVIAGIDAVIVKPVNGPEQVTTCK